MHFIWLQQKEQFDDAAVHDLVIVWFSTKTKEILKHIDVVATTISRLVWVNDQEGFGRADSEHTEA